MSRNVGNYKSTPHNILEEQQPNFTLTDEVRHNQLRTQITINTGNKVYVALLS